MGLYLFNNKLIINNDGSLELSESLYWRCCNFGAFELPSLESGATLIPPDFNTSGGYQLDELTEYIYFSSGIYNDWDEISDPKLFITWECNIDNSGGNITDKVDLKLNCSIKGLSDIDVGFQSLNSSTIIGQSPRYKQFESIFTLDYDSISSPIEMNDLLTFRLNLKTNTSDIDNIIVNFISFRYQARKVNIEIDEE